MKILAFDLGTGTGWAVADNAIIVRAGTEELATRLEIRAIKETRLDRRNDCRPGRLHAFITRLLGEYNPQLVVFEDVQFATYTLQQQLWSSLRTALQLAAKGTQIDCVNVTKLKVFATGKPHALKEEMAVALGNALPDQFRLIERDRELRPLHLATGQVLDDNAVDAVHLTRWANSTYR